MKKLFTTNKTLVICLTAAIALAAGTAAFAQAVRSGRIAAYGISTWSVWASAGPSRVVVDGDGTTDLDCFVYDRFGTFLGSDEDGTDYCIVDIYQRTSGNIRIRIENLDGVWNDYVLVVN